MAISSPDRHHRTMNNSPLIPPPPPQAPLPAPYPPLPADRATTPANWIGAIAAALAIQVAAAITLMGAFVIVIIAAFAGYGDSSADAPAYVVLALPVGLAGIGLYIFSGGVAARIAKDGRGWLMLIGGPAILLALRVGTVLLAG